MKAIMSVEFFRMASRRLAYILKDDFLSNGLHIDVNGGALSLTAISHSRLGRVTTRMAASDEPFRASFTSLLFPALQSLATLCREIAVTVENGTVRIGDADYSVSAPRNDGPHFYRDLLTSTPTLWITVRTRALLPALKEVCRDEHKIRSCMLSIRPGCIAIIDSKDRVNTLACSSSGELEVRVNAAYLADAISAVGGRSVSIGFTDAESCIFVATSPDAHDRHGFMPLRIA